MPEHTHFVLQVLCRFITNARTHIMSRKNIKNPLDFNRSYAEYETGFGDLNSEFWIGLEKVRLFLATVIIQHTKTISIIRNAITEI